MTQQLSYCGQMVKEQDPDRFLLSMFAPAERREALWALFAFNHEIAKTREVVSETQLGLIRLQWWRDRIEELYCGDVVAEHEVLQALSKAIDAYDLPREHFEMLLHAREFDLEDVLPGNVEGVVNYADFTTTPLMKLAVRVAGGDAEGEPVQPVAVNYALAGILRAVPHFAKERRCLLPEDLMKLHGQSINQLYELKAAEGLSDIVRAVSAEAVEGVKPDNRFLKASNKLAFIYFKQLKSCGCDVFHPRMQVSPPFKALRLFL